MLHFLYYCAIIILSETEGSAVQFRRSSHYRIVGSLVRHGVFNVFGQRKTYAEELHRLCGAVLLRFSALWESVFCCPHTIKKE